MVAPAPETPRTDAPAPRRGGGPVAAVLGLVVLLCAVAFPFAPVVEPRAEYTWSGADAALPLMPYQPVELTADTTCDAARAPGTLLSTVPADPDPAATTLDGLTLESVDGGLRVRSAGVDLGTVPLPAGDCTLGVRSTPSDTSVLLDGAPVTTRAGDLRPAVAALTTDRPGAVTVHLVADTRFQTTITPVKAAIAVVGVLALVGMLLALRGPRRVRLLPRGWRRPRLPDLGVTATLALWWVVGPVTVDDGYIAGIVRDRASSGFIGNVYRWLNAPEAPFSWFYDLYWLWAQVSPSTVWMRLPSILLGLLTWGVLTRLTLPRLLPRAAAWTGWLAAACFLLWWLPLTLGLRPEPWVALGTLLVFVLVERAVALRAVGPLAAALLVGGVTTAVTPGGLMAFAPLLAAAVPLLRTVRRAGWWVLPVLLAAPAAAVFLMVPDQSLAGLLEATRVRTVIGGGQPWYTEVDRYDLLLGADFQGSLAKRAPVLLGVAAAVAVLWSRRNRPSVRLAVAFLVALASMTTNPTKWTQHFGDLAGLGAAVLVVGITVLTRRALGARVGPWVVELGTLTVVGSLVWAGRNNWPFVSNWWGLTWSTVPPLLGGVEVATLWLVAGALLVGVVLLVLAWRRAGDRPLRPARWWPTPALVATVLVVAVVALQVLTFARTSWSHRDGYTLASDAVSTLRGRPCGLQEQVSVETDMAAGLLPADGGGSGLPVLPTDAGGTELPGVRVTGAGTTDWFVLDPAQRSQELPVVVTVSGAVRPGDTVDVEFDDGTRTALTPAADTPRDVRLLAPAAATRVRLTVDAGTPDTPAAVTLPRVPRLTPMTALLPAGTEAILDWPVAFVLPCLTPAALPLGTTVLPGWRVGPPQDDAAAGITYAPGFGGPFAAARLLVTEQRMPGYLTGEPLRDPVQLYRWVPLRPWETLAPQVSEQVRGGWSATGRTRVPGVDGVG